VEVKKKKRKKVKKYSKSVCVFGCVLWMFFIIKL
jgi:hypothetical protein